MIRVFRNCVSQLIMNLRVTTSLCWLSLSLGEMSSVNGGVDVVLDCSCVEDVVELNVCNALPHTQVVLWQD